MAPVGHTDGMQACAAAPALFGRTRLRAARADRGADGSQPHPPPRFRAVTSARSYSGAEYYPFLLAAVKLGVALLLARLAWRFVRAHTAARAGRRVLAAVGKSAAPAAAPAARPLAAALARSPSSRPRPSTSCRPTPSRPPPGAGRCSRPGCTPLRCPSSPCSPCSSRSPGARSPAGCASTSATPRTPVPAQTGSAARAEPPRVAHARTETAAAPPRKLFGLAFESRPPPLPA